MAYFLKTSRRFLFHTHDQLYSSFSSTISFRSSFSSDFPETRTSYTFLDTPESLGTVVSLTGLVFSSKKLLQLSLRIRIILGRSLIPSTRLCYFDREEGFKLVMVVAAMVRLMIENRDQLSIRESRLENTVLHVQRSPTNVTLKKKKRKKEVSTFFVRLIERETITRSCNLHTVLQRHICLVELKIALLKLDKIVYPLIIVRVL